MALSKLTNFKFSFTKSYGRIIKHTNVSFATPDSRSIAEKWAKVWNSFNIAQSISKHTLREFILYFMKVTAQRRTLTQKKLGKMNNPIDYRKEIS